MNYELKIRYCKPKRRHCERSEERHCERSEATPNNNASSVGACFVAALLAMTALGGGGRCFVVGACFGRASLAMTALAVRNCFFGCCARNNGVDWTFLCVSSFSIFNFQFSIFNMTFFAVDWLFLYLSFFFITVYALLWKFTLKASSI
jgi:hypothetical protein